MRTLAGNCVAVTMSQEGVEVGDGCSWAGGQQEMPGRGRGRGEGFAVSGYSEAHTFPEAGSRPHLKRRVTAISPRRDAASSTKSGGSRVKGQRRGVTWPTSSQAWDALPSPHPPPVTVGTLAFSGKFPGGMGWG